MPQKAIQRLDTHTHTHFLSNTSTHFLSHTYTKTYIHRLCENEERCNMSKIVRNVRSLRTFDVSNDVNASQSSLTCLRLCGLHFQFPPTNGFLLRTTVVLMHLLNNVDSFIFFRFWQRLYRLKDMPRRWSWMRVHTHYLIDDDSLKKKNGNITHHHQRIINWLSDCTHECSHQC